MTGTLRAVFLDRDDTIIHNSGDLGDPEQVRVIDQAADAIKLLKNAGYLVIVVSNQGGVARGTYSEDDVDAVNQRIAHLVHEASGALIDRFYYCPFHPNGTVPEYACEHPWRKPQPGMLLQAADDLDLDLTQCWMIGDQERDVEAGIAAGCHTILVQTGRDRPDVTRADIRAATLTEAAEAVLGKRLADTDSAASRQPATPGPSDTNRSDIPESLSRSDGPVMSRGSDEVMTRLTDLHAELRVLRALDAEFTAGRLLTVIATVLIVGLAVGFALYLEPQTALVWVSVAAVGELALIGLVLVVGRKR